MEIHYVLKKGDKYTKVEVWINTHTHTHKYTQNDILLGYKNE